MRRMYQSKMYQVSGTSALASYKPAFKVINGGAKKNLLHLSVRKFLT